jgi:23S rRNA (guanosine2251-2'-O)-methyltransferase
MTTKKKSPKERTKEVLYGAHPIIEMLKAKRRKLIALYTRKPLPKAWQRIKQYLPKTLPTIQYVEKNILDGIAQSPEHMGVVAFVSPFQYRSKMFAPKEHQFILLLDAIQDVGNLGAILRSAYCSGIQGVILTKRGGSLLTPAVCKAAAGLVEHLEIYVVPSASHAVNEIKKAGYTLYMAVIDGENAFEVEYKKPLCLVIGNEATGIEKSVRADGNAITIPQKTSEISYNASVAAGILLSTISFQANILGKTKKK